MERQFRLNLIKSLILHNNIENQEQLQEILSGHGVVVTQATLSRDLRLLKVGKVHRSSGSYCYSINSDERKSFCEDDFVDDIARGFISVDFSGNMCVVRTLPGYANTVAVAFDRLDADEILGTVAGDDTVFMVMREDVTKEKFKEIFEKKFPSLYI